MSDTSSGGGIDARGDQRGLALEGGQLFALGLDLGDEIVAFGIGHRCRGWLAFSRGLAVVLELGLEF
jgi:hypothetical protein